MNRGKRLTALLLALTMCLSILPANALAAELGSEAEATEVVEPKDEDEPVEAEEPQMAEPAETEKPQVAEPAETKEPQRNESVEQAQEPSPTTMDTSGTCGENLTWKLVDGTLTISGSGAMTNWSSSSSVPWYSDRDKIKKVQIGSGVTSIGSSAFYHCSSMTSVTIPNSVTSIGYQAFHGCGSLTGVTIGNGVKSIGDYAFYGCKGLTSVTIPDSVTSIGNNAFEGCRSLTNMIIPDSVTSIGNETFYECSNMTSVTIPTSVTHISNWMFYGCKGLTSVTIPDSVTSIGVDAFSGCNSLSSVTIPNSVTSIGSGAFYGCNSLSSVTIPNSVTSIAGSVFYGCSSLTSVTIPDSVTSIDGSAFYGCGSLTEFLVVTGNASYSSKDGVLFNKEGTKLLCYPGGKKGQPYVIPDSVTSINEGAFRSCSSSISVTIPNSVTSIDDSAFEDCSGLTSVTIPNSVTSIGSSAFEDCSSLTNVTIPDSVTSIGEDAFRNCSSLTSVTIGEGATSIGDYAFYKCNSLASVTIGKGVTSIGYCAFNTSNKLTGVYISDVSAWCRIQFDEEYANPLYYAHNLYLGGKLVTALEIPQNVTSISAYAFYGCASLTSITIPNSVTSIGYEAFSGCTNLNEVHYEGSEAEWANISIGGNNWAITGANKSGTCGENLSWTVKDRTLTISGNGAMGNYEVTDDDESRYRTPWNDYRGYITQVVLGEGITSIGDNAFYGYIALTSVTIPNSVTSIGQWAFYGCSSLTSATIGSGVTSIGDYAFRDCNSLTGVTIGKKVASIGDGAFSGCSSLTNVTIPNSVTSIGGAAFSGCSSMTSVTIPNNVKNIGDSTFSSCSSLTSVSIPNSVTNIGWNAFASCSKLTSVTIGNSVTSIGRNAFECCSSLTRVTIPISVKKIQYGAFNDCDKLKDVYYAGCEAEWKKIAIAMHDTDESLYPVQKIHWTKRVTIHFAKDNPSGTSKTGISSCKVSLSTTTYTYNGKAKEPTVTVEDLTSTQASTGGLVVMASGKKLKKGKDYTLTYANNVNAGTAKVTITGKGNYTGKKTVKYTIKKAKNSITASNITQTASTKARTVSLGTKAKGGAKLSYQSNNKSVAVSKSGKVTIPKKFAGKAMITITAAETKNYKKTTKEATVIVKPSSTKLSSVKSGKPNELTIKWAKNTTGTGYRMQYAASSKFAGAKTVKLKSNQTSYTLTGLKEKRKYYVRIRTYKTSGKETYYSAWSSAKNATIKAFTPPAAVKLSSVKSARVGEMTAAWGKNTKADGYQVQYSTAQNFKGAKAITVKKAKTTNVTIKNLTKGKKYYVRVRTYQKASGKTYYSTWSKTKTVTIKK